MSSYDYVRRAYGVDPVVGQRVRHTELRGARAFGTISRESPSQGHHVMVRFDGDKHPSPCHPTALDYAPVEALLPQPKDINHGQ